MDRDDIIRMAREAGYVDSQFTSIATLERFANLVEADTRDACADILEKIRREYFFDPPKASIFLALHMLWAHFKNTSRPLWRVGE